MSIWKFFRAFNKFEVIDNFQSYSKFTVRPYSTGHEDGGENTQSPAIDPSKDRRTPVPVETGLRYINSSAYKETYGDKPVWHTYRRNHKGQLPPKKTRYSCVRSTGFIKTGNPCPICRDEYLVLDKTNVKLLNQFISQHTGQILSYSITGLCQRKHKELRVAIDRAKDQGLITFDVPHREYDYTEYTPASINQ